MFDQKNRNEKIKKGIIFIKLYVRVQTSQFFKLMQEYLPVQGEENMNNMFALKKY